MEVFRVAFLTIVAGAATLIGVIFLAASTAQASSVVARVDLSSQRMNVYVNGSLQAAAGTPRREAPTVQNGFLGTIAHGSTTTHQCPILFSSVAGTQCMEQTILGLSDGAPLTAAYVCIRATPVSYSLWFGVMASNGPV